MNRWIISCLIAAAALTNSVRAEESPVETNAVPHHRPALTDEQKAQRVQRADESWNKLSGEERIRLMRLHDALVDMPPDERRMINQHVDRFLKMSPAEREQMKKNLDRWKTMSPEERARARDLYQRRHRELDQRTGTNAPANSVQSPVKP